MDVMMIAGKAVSLPLFVRIPDGEAATILSALDMGAAGLLIPHVDTAEFAADIVARSKFVDGRRGFSRATRSAGFGELPQERVIAQGNATAIVCQIESPEAVSNVEAIARTPGVDILFIGRADLALAMGVTATSSALADAVNRIAAAAHEANKRLGMYVATPEEIPKFSGLGASWFIVGSDQAFLRKGARDAAASIRA
jgi:2-keto-3-deoxy-L-rhamnonate aldolase RhmA